MIKTYKMPKLSQEQQKILDDLKNGKKVITEALAGTGKTTVLIQAILQHLKLSCDSLIIMLSYNNELVQTTRAIIDYFFDFEFSSRVLVSTYHGLLSSLSNSVVNNDLLFLEVLAKTDFSKLKNNWKFSKFSFIIVDETQDARDSYFDLFLQLLFNVSATPFDKIQILAVGNVWQILYDFYAVNRADARFLTCMPDIIQDNKWIVNKLSVSYRSTKPMANFINALFPERFTIPRPNPENKYEKYVTILITDIYHQVANKYVLPLAQRKKNGGLMIIFPSLNSKSPAVKIVDCLVQNGLNVHVARSGCLTDGSGNSDNYSTSKNKILVKTRHGTKGLEEDDVVAFTMENLFLQPHKLTNADYVEFTRAKQELYIVLDIRNISQKHIENFIKRTQLKQSDLRIIIDGTLKQNDDDNDNDNNDNNNDKQKQKEGPRDFTTPTLFSFIDVTHLQKLLNMITISVEQVPITSFIENKHNDDNDHEHLTKSMLNSYFHQMNITFDQGTTYINISQICGVAITLALEYTVTREIPLCIRKMQIATSNTNKNVDILKNKILKQQLELCMSQLTTFNIKETDYSPSFVFARFKIFAHMAALLDSFTGYGEKLSLIKNYDFIDKPQVFERYKALFESLLKIISHHKIEEKDLIWYREDVGRFKYDNQSVKIIAKPTIISKCGLLLIDIIHSPSVSHEHHLSALMSAQIAGNANTQVFIINIGDGSIEKSKLNIIQNKTNEQISMQFISAALSFKLYKEDPMTDRNFIKKYRNNIAKIFAANKIIK